MPTMPWLLAVACLTWAGTSVATVALASSPEKVISEILCADADGDAVCDVDDNCPTDENPEQDDADGDGEGDLCDLDAAPGAAGSTLTIRKETAAGKSNGTLVMKGVLAMPPSAIASADVIGLMVDATDGRTPFALGYDWRMGPDCSVARSGKVRCGSADRRFAVVLAPDARTPGVVRFKARFIEQPIDASVALRGPAMAAVTFGPEPGSPGADARVAVLSDCRSPRFGLDCRVQ
jgi:hypothetical protein